MNPMSETAAQIASEVAKQVEIHLWNMNIQQATRSLQDGWLTMLFETNKTIDLQTYLYCCLPMYDAQALEKNEIEIVGQLVQKTESELLQFDRIGEVRLKTIKDMLATAGLKLRTESEDEAENNSPGADADG